MLIKNLVLNFHKQEGGQIIFQTETGATVALAEQLLAAGQDKNKQVYLSLDSQPIIMPAEQQKNLLNELLGHEEETK